MLDILDAESVLSLAKELSDIKHDADVLFKVLNNDGTQAEPILSIRGADIRNQLQDIKASKDLFNKLIEYNIELLELRAMNICHKIIGDLSETIQK